MPASSARVRPISSGLMISYVSLDLSMPSCKRAAVPQHTAEQHLGACTACLLLEQVQLGQAQPKTQLHPSRVR